MVLGQMPLASFSAVNTAVILRFLNTKPLLSRKVIALCLSFPRSTFLRLAGCFSWVRSVVFALICRNFLFVCCVVRSFFCSGFFYVAMVSGAGICLFLFWACGILSFIVSTVKFWISFMSSFSGFIDMRSLCFLLSAYLFFVPLVVFPMIGFIVGHLESCSI